MGRMASTADTVAIVNDLQAQILELRAEVDRLRTASSARQTEPPGAPAVANRRQLLKLAGATAVGAVASTAIAASAAADQGYSVTGGSITVGDVVRQQLNGSRPTEVGFLLATVSTPALASDIQGPSMP
jgi:methylthioribose-1-phosphate isomerase